MCEVGASPAAAVVCTPGRIRHMFRLQAEFLQAVGLEGIQPSGAPALSAPLQVTEA